MTAAKNITTHTTANMIYTTKHAIGPNCTLDNITFKLHASNQMQLLAVNIFMPKQSKPKPALNSINTTDVQDTADMANIRN